MSKTQLRNCPKCHRPLQPNASRCRACGATFDPLFDPSENYTSGQRPSAKNLFTSQDTASHNYKPSANDTTPASRQSGDGAKGGVVSSPNYGGYPSEYPTDPHKKSRYAPITFGGWIGILLLMLIPGVDIVLLVIWACGAKKYSKRNFARAVLVMLFFAIVGFLLLWLIKGSFWQRYLELIFYYW